MPSPTARKPRAHRFALAVPARVRAQGHLTWRDADVVNVSHTGILLAVGETFPPAATIDLEFTVRDGIDRLSDIRCLGHVVRDERRGGRRLLAASVEQYALQVPVRLAAG